MDWIKKINDEGMAALLLFFAECCNNLEGDDLEIEFSKHQGGETATYDKDFNPVYTYGTGLYLEVTIDNDCYAATLFEKYSKYIANYASINWKDDDDDDSEDKTTYTFRLTDTLNDLSNEIRKEDLA